MKYVCEPGRVWLIPRRFGRVKQANIVRYTYPGRPHIFYARRYVVPHNPRTPAQVLMRQLFGALSRDWLGLLTPPQRDAWTAFARYYNRRWGAAWIDCARQLSRCWPHILTAYHRRIIRRWLVGGRPLSGQQAYVKFNSRLGRIGRPKLLWPPPLLPFRPNPVQEVRLRWDAVAADINPPRLNPNPNPFHEPWFASELPSIPPLPFRRGEGRGKGSVSAWGFMVPMRGQKTVEANLNPIAADVHRRPSDQKSTIKNQKSPSAPRLRLELVLHRRVKCDLLLFGSAPCSAGWSTMRRPVYLGLLPVPKEGVHDLTALYLARFRAPGPNEQVFIRSCQQRHGWESAPQDHSALVPPKPAPLPPPAPNDPFPIGPSRFAPGFPRHCNSLTCWPAAKKSPNAVSSFNPFNPFNPFNILSPGTHRPHTPCTRGTRFPRAAATADVRRRSCLACHRRKSHCRELWRGT